MNQENVNGNQIQFTEADAVSDLYQLIQVDELVPHQGSGQPANGAQANPSHNIEIVQEPCNPECEKKMEEMHNEGVQPVEPVEPKIEMEEERKEPQQEAQNMELLME